LGIFYCQYFLRTSIRTRKWTWEESGHGRKVGLEGKWTWKESGLEGKWTWALWAVKRAGKVRQIHQHQSKDIEDILTFKTIKISSL
jgi:hypothetical protein